MIHPTAVIEPGAVLGQNVKVGPFCYIAANVVIGDDTVLESHVVLKGPTVIGKGNHFYQFTSIGEDCQDKKYKDEPTELHIGDFNIFREGCTVHRGTIQDKGLTVIGSHNLFMNYTHVAHDCVIGDYVTFAPGVKCNGNIHIEDHAYIGTGAVIKQGTPDKPLVIGKGAIVGMGAVVTKSVPAGVTVVGNPARILEKK